MKGKRPSEAGTQAIERSNNPKLKDFGCT